jgi:hypothetical protein
MAYWIVENSHSTIDGLPVDNMWTEVYYTVVSYQVGALRMYLKKQICCPEAKEITLTSFNKRIDVCLQARKHRVHKGPSGSGQKLQCH